MECSSGGKLRFVTPPTKIFDCDAPGVDRFHFEGVMSNADLNDYYLPVFQRPLHRARPAAIMCSFARPVRVPLSTPFALRKGVLNEYSSTRVSLWDSLMFARVLEY